MMWRLWRWAPTSCVLEFIESSRLVCDSGSDNWCRIYTCVCANSQDYRKIMLAIRAFALWLCSCARAPTTQLPFGTCISRTMINSQVCCLHRCGSIQLNGFPAFTSFRWLIKYAYRLPQNDWTTIFFIHRYDTMTAGPIYRFIIIIIVLIVTIVIETCGR